MLTHTKADDAITSRALKESALWLGSDQQS